MQVHSFPICLEWRHYCYPHPPPHPRPRRSAAGPPPLLLLFHHQPASASASASANSCSTAHHPIIHQSLSFYLPFPSPASTTRGGGIATRRKNTGPPPRSSQPRFLHAACSSNNNDSATILGSGEASDDISLDDDEGESEGEGDGEGEDDYSINNYRSSDDDDGGGIEIEIGKIGKNSRRIRSRIAIEGASLETVWNILTDYEKLADFIPGLIVSQLLEKKGNFVRLYQIGQQKLAFGLNFNAKGIVDCYEKHLENLPIGRRREIEFKMIEGDFKLFEGKWSIEEYNVERCEDWDASVGQESLTTLTYAVDVEPKLWLPVGLVEGRLCREIKVNLSSIRTEAQKASRDIPAI